jgi:hypothetical protein
MSGVVFAPSAGTVYSADFTMSKFDIVSLSNVNSILGVYETVASNILVVSPTNMTSNTTPSPYVIAVSSAYSSTYSGYSAFNSILDVEPDWLATATPAWLSIDLGSTPPIGAYRLSIGTNFTTTTTPKSWTLQGSSDGINWTTIDTQTNITGWVAATYKTFTLASSATYRYYKLNVSANGAAGAGNMRISEIQLIRIIPSDKVLASPADYRVGYTAGTSDVTVAKLSGGSNVAVTVRYS